MSTPILQTIMNIKLDDVPEVTRLEDMARDRVVKKPAKPQTQKMTRHIDTMLDYIESMIDIDPAMENFGRLELLTVRIDYEDTIFSEIQKEKAENIARVLIDSPEIKIEDIRGMYQHKEMLTALPRFASTVKMRDFGDCIPTLYLPCDLDMKRVIAERNSNQEFNLFS